MIFYVAGKFEDKMAIRYLQRKLRERGHKISFDWTRYKNIADDDPERITKLARCAVVDALGVKKAGAYVGLFRKDFHYRGAIGELGMSIIEGKWVFLIGHANDKCVFSYHPLVHRFDTIEHFLLALPYFEERFNGTK